MVRRQIDFDEETDRRLADLAQDFGGDLGQALAELMQSRESVESFLDHCEESHQAALTVQRDQSEREFREGRTVAWSEVKRRNHL
jgi:hypothetical protein